MMSEVVASRYANSALSPILIVNAFDRVDRNQDVRQTDAAELRSAVRAPGSGSTFDRVRAAVWQLVRLCRCKPPARSRRMGPFTASDTAQNEAVGSGAVNLANYKAVIWLAGEEDAANSTFTSAEAHRDHQLRQRRREAVRLRLGQSPMNCRATRSSPARCTRRSAPTTREFVHRQRRRWEDLPGD
jgi:hypothetical protein